MHASPIALRRRSFIRLVPALSGLALSGLALSACDSQGAPAADPAKSVAVIRPASGSVTRYLYETGTVKAVNSVDLVARVAGYLKSVDYKDGQEVKAGQQLFQIEAEPYQAQLQQAQASVEQAQATLDNAARQFDRQEQLGKTAVTAVANVDSARASRDTSQAQLDSAKASLRQAEISLGYTTINAPFDGFVTEHQADVGVLVGANGATTLATIIQLDPMQVSFSISDSDMLRIRKEMRAKGLKPKDLQRVPIEIATAIDTDFPHRGTLDYAAPQTAADTGTLAARAVVANPDRLLLPGLFVRIRIPVETVNDALMLPPSAIGTDQSGRYVLVVNGDGRVERRAVTLLDRVGEQQPVEGELKAADRVIRNVLSGARAGETVKATPADQP